MSDSLMQTWRQIILGEEKSWVLFQNGTCVILMEPEPDLKAQATALLQEWGPVYPGTPAGDFSVINLEAHPVWIVTCHHPDVLTYVGPEDVGADASEVAIGLVGRSKRHQDAEELEVIHVEDRRGKTE